MRENTSDFLTPYTLTCLTQLNVAMVKEALADCPGMVKILNSPRANKFTL